MWSDFDNFGITFIAVLLELTDCFQYPVYDPVHKKYSLSDLQRPDRPATTSHKFKIKISIVKCHSFVRYSFQVLYCSLLEVQLKVWSF